MSEIHQPNPDQILPPVGTHAGIHLTRMFFGLLWIAIVFAVLAGAIYLSWPWLHARFMQFYD